MSATLEVPYHRRHGSAAELVSSRPSTASLAREDLNFLKRKISRSIPKGARAIRSVDLFSGCGGLSLGLKEACCDLGFRFMPVWAADSDPEALQVYRRNFSPTSVSQQPLEKWLPGELGEDPYDIELELKVAVGKLDFLLAGPPCQGHSALNNRTRHTDERNLLYSKVGRFVEIVAPRHVFIENVPTVVLDRNRAIHSTVTHLRDLGYFVDARVVDLSTIGVPQRRKRHVVVASKVRQPRLAEWLAANEVPTRSIHWAIGDLEIPSENGLLNTPSVLSEANQKRISHLFKHDLYDLPNLKRPDCHQEGDHTYKSMYGRLSWNEPAQTITTGFNSPGQGRYIHPSQRRTLTPREAARLQFLPDDFDFSDVRFRSTLARLIGNAVPPKLPWIVCRELLR